MRRHSTLITATPVTGSAKLRELWEYRELALSMMLRDIKVRYKQTVLGVAWAVLQPVLTMIIFTVIFGGLAQIPSDGFPYPVFVYSGLLAWNLFSTGVSMSGASMIGAGNMISKVYFPRLIVPLAALGVGVVDFLVSFCVLILLMFGFGMLPSAQIIFFPIFLVGLLGTAIGVGTWLAAVTVAYRDFRFVIPFMVQIWMYITPVIYPASFIPEAWRWLFYFNPVFGWVAGIKSSILGTPIDWVAVGSSLCLTILLIALGLKYFTHAERRFADII
ncbi:MAG: ABC transporter permease [Pseudomonadota bacterium]